MSRFRKGFVNGMGLEKVSQRFKREQSAKSKIFQERDYIAEGMGVGEKAINLGIRESEKWV